jgi:hypothetical protein
MTEDGLGCFRSFDVRALFARGWKPMPLPVHLGIAWNLLENKFEAELKLAAVLRG